MATRQYIGARYVPKFYQNSVDGSTQWEANVVYQPLVYVTLQNGHMYISKKQVPATVGTPANNVDYWLDVGNYNGFLEELQDQIDDLSTEIDNVNDKINHKSVVVITDSYGVKGEGFSSVSFLDVLPNRLHNVTLYTSAVRGASFGRAGYLYLTQLQDLGASITDKESITDIMIVGGYNDLVTYPQNGYATMQDAEQGMGTFATYANANYPNAKLHFICVASSSAMGSGATIQQFMKTTGTFYSYLHSHGFNAPANAMGVIANNQMHLSDTIHPSDNGQYAIANYVGNYIMTGGDNINYALNIGPASITVASGVTISSLVCYMTQTGLIKDLNISSLYYTFASSRTIGIDEEVELFTLPETTLVNDMYKTNSYLMNGWSSHKLSYYVKNNKVYAINLTGAAITLTGDNSSGWNRTCHAFFM